MMEEMLQFAKSNGVRVISVFWFLFICYIFEDVGHIRLSLCFVRSIYITENEIDTYST